MALAPWVLGRRSNVYDPFSLEVWDPFDSVQPVNRQTGGEVAAVANTHVDWKETPEAHTFKADLPGMQKEDIKVQVEDGRILQISGERSKENVGWDDKIHRMERQYGKFSRRFRLPKNARLDGVNANLENGVLTVTVPKAPEKKPQVRAIDISVAITNRLDETRLRDIQDFSAKSVREDTLVQDISLSKEDSEPRAAISTCSSDEKELAKQSAHLPAPASSSSVSDLERDLEASKHLTIGDMKSTELSVRDSAAMLHEHFELDGETWSEEDLAEVTVEFQETFSGHTSPITRCRFSAAGTNIASASVDGTVRIWTYDSSTPTSRNATIYCGAEIMSLDWEYKSDRLLLIGTAEGGIKAWNVDAKRVVCDLSTSVAFPNVLDLKCSPVEPIFVSAAASRG